MILENSFICYNILHFASLLMAFGSLDVRFSLSSCYCSKWQTADQPVVEAGVGVVDLAGEGAGDGGAGVEGEGEARQKKKR